MTCQPNRPLLSVLVTTYNAQDSIARLLDSVLSQEGVGELFDLEVIVVDDCSKDQTAELIRKHYPQVRLEVNTANSGGPNRGRNRGLELARGEWIVIADDDDQWLPCRLKRQLQASRKAPIVSSGYRYADASRKQTFDRVSRLNGFDADGFMYFETNLTFRRLLARDPQKQSCYIGSLFFSSMLKDRLFEETHGWLDVDWIIRLFEGQASVEVREPLYIRHFNGTGNLSMNARYRRDDYEGAMRCLQAYAGRFPAETKQGIQRANGSYARYFYLVGDMPQARRYFRKAGCSLKNIAYYLTSYAGSKWVKKHFNVFG